MTYAQELKEKVNETVTEHMIHTGLKPKECSNEDCVDRDLIYNIEAKAIGYKKAIESGLEKVRDKEQRVLRLKETIVNEQQFFHFRGYEIVLEFIENELDELEEEITYLENELKLLEDLEND